jgi:hypothetical protein
MTRYASEAVVAVTLAATFAVLGCNRTEPQQSAPPPQPSPEASKRASAPAPDDAGLAVTWETRASTLGSETGQTFMVRCPAGGSAQNVWGAGVYTADSSVCTAAVHAGAATLADGGLVTIELRPGEDIYGASIRNNVTTSAYAAWHHSFVIKPTGGDQPLSGNPDASAVPILWTTNASIAGAVAGKQYRFDCPSHGNLQRAWGSDVYTNDSTICTAAVHAGKITAERGGIVTIELQPGQESYHGSQRNGVSTQDYGRWGSSFRFR